MDPLQELWDLYEGYKSPPMDKVKRKIGSLDMEKKLGMGSRQKDKRRMKMDMLAYVDKDPELRSMHRGAKQAIEKKNKEKFRQKMEEALDELMNVVDKPSFESEEPSAMGTPTEEPPDGAREHPVIQQRRQVDDLRAQGMEDTEAHQAVYGEVDLSNPESKAQLAATLHRIQTDDEKRGVEVDKNATFKSLFAREKEAEADSDVTPEDMKTPMAQEVPDGLEQQQEEWYNFDVSYLQQFGRA